MKLLHVRFNAWTATYKVPFINSGTMVSLPVPSYSSVVGLISCCLGRPLLIDETLIAFTYSYNGSGIDLETTKRLEMDKNILKEKKDDSVTNRAFHVNPQLDIYLSNIDLEDAFKKPRGVPTLGRSQDISWITKIELIESVKVEGGKIRPTLIPFPNETIGGRLIRLCDYYINESLSFTREASNMSMYQIVPVTKEGINIVNDSLYRINDKTNEVVYMHQIGGLNDVNSKI